MQEIQTNSSPKGSEGGERLDTEHPIFNDKVDDELDTPSKKNGNDDLILNRSNSINTPDKLKEAKL